MLKGSSKSLSNFSQPLKNNTWASIKWGPWQAILATFLAFSVSLVATIFIGGLVYGSPLSEFVQNIVLYIVSSAVLLVAGGLFLVIKQIAWKDFFGALNPLHLLLVPAFYVMYLACTYTIQALLALLPSYDGEQEQALGLETGSGGLAMIFIALVLVILPPLAEELIFRGILYRGMTKRWPKVLAALTTSILFGLAHGQWNVGADTFVLSLILIFALEQTKSLWVPIGVHALKNFVAFTLVFVLKL